MRIVLLLVLQAVSGHVHRLGKAVGTLIKKSPLKYEGDGGNGTLDYMKYALNKAMPSLVKSLGNFIDKVPPKKTKLRFSHATVEEILANFNNSLTSSCAIRDFNRNLCLDNTTYSDAHLVEDPMVDAVALVVANNKQNKIVVSYRASITTQNFIDDLNGALVDMPSAPDGARVHRGFYLNYLATYSKVRRTLMKLLDDPRFKDYSVLVTGYSLGGGAATIAISDLTKLVRLRPDPRHIELISYAAPRAGNSEYAAYLASLKVPITRVTLAYDFVSHMPIRELGFTHAGQEIHTIQPARLGNYTIKMCSQEYDEDPRCTWAESKDTTPVRHFYPFGAWFPKHPFS
ncbi:hypothetical protein DSO57_1003390 [Entomophthora muscae]|uniref:Uncharacterized protein n=1 Tax=Entomophthora muscae TaxID=34485 RepID=A0ACC2TJR5_9FUNG|nr:hypothetical protein DSO57_1003390 [Entomophthora muscae]